jgi:glycosyltransferase involved in cell wall biosynthesis
MRKTPHYLKARSAFLADLVRDRTRNRIRRFGQALVLASEFVGQVSRLHAHFLHTPASVVRYASIMMALPFSASAHAKDIWTSPDWDLAAKLDEGLWTVACTRAAALHLAGLTKDPGKVFLVYHGLDLDRFPPPLSAGSLRDGRDRVEPVRLLSVGRAVPKKGFDLLVEALALLPRDLSWRFDHVGGGELRDELKARAATLGIADRIAWHGSMHQEEVLTFYRSADIFALPCRVAADGDRDGLPNVLVEAASQRLPLVSTPVSGIPELIDDGETGLLVPPEDAGSVARALERLIRDPELRYRLGTAAEAKVRSQLDHRAGISQLLYLFESGQP